MNEELESQVEESETDTARLKRILKEKVSFKEWADSLSHDFINFLTVISGYASLAQFPSTDVAHNYEQVEKHTYEAKILIEKYVSRADSAKAKEHLLHNLSNTLTPIYGLAGLLKVHPEKLGEYGVKIQFGIDRAVRIIRELQLFTSADLPLPKEQINLLQLFELALQESSESKINVNREYGSGSHYVFANQNELSRMYTSIIQNAIEAEADMLYVSAHAFDGKVYTKLIDNGKGVDDTDMQHIFEPFFTTKYQNLGLSLATGKKIIEKYLGNIRFESKKWKGTVVSIEFPSCK